MSAAASATPGHICATLTVTPSAPPTGVISSNDTEGGFAFQAIAGLSFPIPNVPGLSLTAEYRFFGVPGGRSICRHQRRRRVGRSR